MFKFLDRMLRYFCFIVMIPYLILNIIAIYTKHLQLKDDPIKSVNRVIISFIVWGGMIYALSTFI